MVYFNGQIFGSTIEKGNIYYFRSNLLVHTSEPHYFIVIANPSDELIILTCCTSQFEKRARFIELNNIPFTTLVWIKPNEENCLKVDSYVDCNSSFKYSKAELIQMYDLNQIEFIGYITKSKLAEILVGLTDSPLIDIATKDIISTGYMG